MTVQQIYDEARFLANVTSNDVSDAQLLVLLNNSVSDQISFVAGLREDFLLKAGTSQNIVASTTDYTLATDVLQLKRLELSFDGTNFYVATRKDLLEDTNLNSTATESTASPKWIAITQSGATSFVIRIQPTPTLSVTNGLRYWYIARPAAMTTGTDVPVTPPELHPALVQDLVRLLKQRDGMEAAVSVALRDKESILARYKNQMAQRNLDQQETFYAKAFEE